jgi:Phosphotransferase enzyme family
MSVRPSSSWPPPRPDPEISCAISLVNFSALCQVGLALRQQPCTCNPEVYSYGGVNLVFELLFEDGLAWIARIRRPDNQYPSNGVDRVLESEVATMQFLHDNTTIPVPAVFYRDARFGVDNSIGLPYLLMESMPGHRLYGSDRADFIPDAYKSKVYRKITDIAMQLLDHPFTAIGMLFPDSSAPSRVHVGQIYDQHWRISPFGPFTDSHQFYLSRWLSLNQFYASTLMGPTAYRPDPREIVSDTEMPESIKSIVDPRTKFGPFYLAHPDYQINNFLFDDQYNITALLDWSGCQIAPLESFLNQPGKIVPDAERFIDATWGDLATAQLRTEWASRRARFFAIFKEEIKTRKDIDVTVFYDIMDSDRPYFASYLDIAGITGVRTWLPKAEFKRFLDKHCGTS